MSPGRHFVKWLPQPSEAKSGVAKYQNRFIICLSTSVPNLVLLSQNPQFWCFHAQICSTISPWFYDHILFSINFITYITITILELLPHSFVVDIIMALSLWLKMIITIENISKWNMIILNNLVVVNLLLIKWK